MFDMIILPVIIGGIIGLVGGFFLDKFFNLPTNKKKEIIKNYLVYAVALAEQAFGSKTGKLKLAKVYNEFVAEMPNFAKLISYETFCVLVDQALVKLKEMMTNKSIEEIINEGSVVNDS